MVNEFRSPAPKLVAVTPKTEGPMEAGVKTFPPEHFNATITDFIQSRFHGVMVGAPVQSEYNNGQITFLLPISVKKVLKTAKGVLEIRLTSHLERDMIQVQAPKIKKAGMIGKPMLESAIDTLSLTGLPSCLQTFLEIEQDKDIQKLTIKEGQFKAFFKTKEKGAVVSRNSNGRNGNTRVAVDPDLFTTVETHDYAEAERLTTVRETNVSEAKRRVELEHTRKEEILNVPRVQELIAEYKAMLNSKIESRRVTAQRNLDILESGQNLVDFLTQENSMVHDSRNDTAIKEIGKIEAKYRKILETL